MITVIGPHYNDGRPWENTAALTEALRDVHENGEFYWGLHNSRGMWNKLTQLQTMMNAEVQTVPFTSYLEEAREWVRDGETVFGRNFTHEAGDDITINKVRMTTRKFWTKFVPSKEEWRIHVFDGLSIARWKKLFDPLVPPFTEEQLRDRCRNHQATAEFDPPRGMRELAKKAVKACAPLTYGACDILVGEDGKQYILEINTAPELDRYTLEAYVGAIRRRFAR